MITLTMQGGLACATLYMDGQTRRWFGDLARVAVLAMATRQKFIMATYN